MARSTHRRCHAKLTALAATHVTEALATTMNAELKALGYKRRVQPDLTGRTDLGVTKVTLRLKDISAKASKVLSEGEQRALGLAMFLAELESLPHTSTVVFDDPSTSLDHVFRQAIARRLVTLSETRQVLVLTHDAVFLTELAMALQRAGSSANYKTIGWDDSPGLVSEGLTWTTMDTKARLADLRERVKALNTIDGSYRGWGSNGTESALKLSRCPANPCNVWIVSKNDRFMKPFPLSRGKVTNTRKSVQ